MDMAAAPPAGMKYTGVRRRKWGKYVSEIRLPNSRDRIWLGSYDSAEKAARAFDAAMFCLRGPTARFNFPDDPPNIPGGQGLPPEQIQAVAQSYAKSYDYARGGEAADPFQSPPSGTAAIIDWSVLDSGHDNAGRVSVPPINSHTPPSNSEVAAAMDWSVLGALDAGYDNAGRVYDFPYYEQPEYSLHFVGGGNDDGGYELYYDLWSYDH